MVNLILRDGARIGIAESDPSGLGVLAWFHANVHAYSMAHATQHEGFSVQEVETVDCGEVADLIAAIATRAGISMESAFVPFSQSRNAKPGKDGKPWRSLNWRVTLKRGARLIVETDYAQGEAWAPASNWPAFYDYDKRIRANAIGDEIETGRIAKPDSYAGFLRTAKPVPAPSIGDVLQSLARDSDVLDSAGFDDWVREFGYDTDSRAAEEIYRTCVDLALKLKSGLGEHLLSEVRLAASFN